MPSHRRTLFLPDLSPDSTNESVSHLFAPFGEIIELKLKFDDRGQCTGVLRYSEAKMAQAAKLALGGQVIGGRKMRILWVNKVQGDVVRPVEEMASAQVHVSFVSRQIENMVNELSLKNLFGAFGEVLKVEIKQAQVREGLESEYTQSGYGFVHFPNTPAGIDAAVRAVQTYSRQTVERVTYDCNLSHRLQSMLDAQKAKAEGYVEITDESSKGNSAPMPQSPASHMAPVQQLQQQMQQLHLQQGQHPSQSQAQQQQQQHAVAYMQSYPQAPYNPHLPQRFPTPGTPQAQDMRMSGTTMSSGSSSARSSFVEGRGSGVGPSRSISKDFSITVPNSPYGMVRQVPSLSSQSQVTPTAAGPQQQQQQPQQSQQQGGAAGVPGGGYSTAGAGGANGVPPAAGGGGTGGGVPVGGAGGGVNVQYPDSLSSNSGDSFRSPRVSMEYVGSPSLPHAQQQQHAMMYRSTSFPSPHLAYSTAGYANYPPQYHDDMYHQQQQQHQVQAAQQQLAAQQGGYMMAYGGAPAAPAPQQHQQQGYEHYVDPQQQAPQGYIYPHLMSPGVMYVTTQDMLSSPYMRGQAAQQQQQQTGGGGAMAHPHQQPYSPHGMVGSPYLITQPLQQQPQHRGGGYGASLRSPTMAPYGGMNFSNIQPRYQSSGPLGPPSGVINTARMGQNHPRAGQANRLLRTVDASTREYQSNMGSGSTSPYGGGGSGSGSGGGGGGGYAGRAYGQPHSPMSGSYHSASTGGSYATAGPAATSSSSGDATTVECATSSSSKELIPDEIPAVTVEAAEGPSVASGGGAVDDKGNQSS